MKPNFVKVVFVIDESGSMYMSSKETINGINEFLQDQNKNSEGECEVSFYKFNSKINKVFEHISSKDVAYLTEEDYIPGGATALYDALGVAIDDTGVYLSNLNEEDRPSKVIVVVITDGEENSSKEYTLDIVKDMIKGQEEKYNWYFAYLGIDIIDMKDAISLGINHIALLSRGMIKDAYNMLSAVVFNYRSSFFDAEVDMFLSKSLDNTNAEYLNEQKSKSV